MTEIEIRAILSSQDPIFYDSFKFLRDSNKKNTLCDSETETCDSKASNLQNILCNVTEYEDHNTY